MPVSIGLRKPPLAEAARPRLASFQREIAINQTLLNQRNRYPSDLFSQTVRGEIAKPRRETDARSRAGRGVLEKYVEGLSDKPVDLATLGSGQACRSSGSAIAAEPLRALEAR
jgi:hypothetical protein